MSQQLPHTKMIVRIAREVLNPHGLSQKGRSRVWVEDHGWWACQVEFQPSAWDRGSYLNVGCDWLWCVKNYLAFSIGHRIDECGFITFQDEASFEPGIRNMAERAIKEVEKYRRWFPDVKSVAEYYVPRAKQGDVWENFHAGVSSALLGRTELAYKLFSELLKVTDNDIPWVIQAKADAANLRSLLANEANFREVISERVRRTRELLKFPLLPSIDFGPRVTS